jgi:Ca2+-binding EF-hand superfamily protein
VEIDCQFYGIYYICNDWRPPGVSRSGKKTGLIPRTFPAASHNKTNQPPMKSQNTLILCAALLGLTPTSNAVDRKPFGTGGLPEMLKTFDLDSDGRLSEEERQAFVAAVRAGEIARPERPDTPTGNPWDTDGDGKLSDEEKTVAQASIRARVLEQRKKHFNDLDTNDDGSVTVDELKGIPGIKEGVAERILANLDKNGDGKVTEEDFLNALRPPVPDNDEGRPDVTGRPA